jgi:quercetin dioxygenase-like cupin family protein
VGRAPRVQDRRSSGRRPSTGEIGLSYRVFDARAVEGRPKLVARELRARAIRLNEFENEPGQAGKEHDEGATGQEEIYVPVAGSGLIVVDGESVQLEPGVFVLVEPESTRQVVAGPDGLSYVVVGAAV